MHGTSIQNSDPYVMTEVIVGAGLSGLYAAWRLSALGKDVQVLEARARIGGRIFSRQADAAFDLGPAWFWPDHQHRLPALLDELEVASFPQWTHGNMVFEPASGGIQVVPPQPMGPPSYRIAGGAGALIDALAARLPSGAVSVETPVNRIVLSDTGVLVTAGSHTVDARHVWMAAPPRLIADRIQFDPAMPDSVVGTMQATPTWMAAHAKVIAVYDTPFWRDAGLSGAAFSYVGPMMEIHDASPVDGGHYALFGFVAVPAVQRAGKADAVKAAAVDQLVRLFGPKAEAPQDVLYLDWSEEAFTATVADADGPATHPMYQPIAVPAPWDESLVFVGTENAPDQGGYMEGCLAAVDAILS